MLAENRIRITRVSAVASGLLTVLDDITVVLDDVAAMSKVAAKKTAGLLGDDLAVNANVVVGLDPKRELPIVGKVALGSLANKAVLVPLALAFPTRIIGPVLLFGGAFLCYEALHKIFHRKEKPSQNHRQAVPQAPHRSGDDPMEFENKKVWGAIQTDAILSIEILAVALGAMTTAPLLTKAITLSVISLSVVLGVYGTVAMIVKMDDVGLRLQKAGSSAVRGLGTFLVKSMPYFMRLLSFVGTAAMLLVGGGIALHGIPGIGHLVEQFIESATPHPILASLLTMTANLIAGFVYGLLAYPLFAGLMKLLGSIKKSFKAEPTPRAASSAAVSP